MPPKKYARYVITEDIRPKTPPPAGFLKRLEDQRQAGNYTDSAHVLSLNEMIAKGALYYDAVWMVAKHGQPPTNIEIAHSHDFDEILGFFGSYNGDAHDLGGEVMPMSPAEFGHLVADEIVKWAKVVKSAGLKVE